MAMVKAGKNSPSSPRDSKKDREDAVLSRTRLPRLGDTTMAGSANPVRLGIGQAQSYRYLTAHKVQVLCKYAAYCTLIFPEGLVDHYLL